MFNMLLSNVVDTAVNTGDSGGMTKFIIIGVVCVVLIAGIAVLGILSKKDNDKDE